MFKSGLLLIAFACVSPTLADAQVTVIPYGSPGYRYLVTTDPFPLGAELPGFDDSAYATGAAPFSSGGAAGNSNCSSGIYNPITTWPVETKLVARLHFTVSGTVSGGLIRFGIDNDVRVYINGVGLADIGHEGCTDFNVHSTPVPDGVIQPGGNVLVALALDRGGASAFDITLTADTVTPTRASSWGRVKQLYR